MHQLVPLPLWIGHAGDGLATRELLAEEIQAVVQLAVEEPPLQLPRELIYCRIPLLDGPHNAPALLQLAVESVRQLLAANTRTLVCCSMGMSRSPAIVAAALARQGRGTLTECLLQVAQVRPVDVSPGLWAAVQTAIQN